MRIIIHAGMHKTGSSALQRALAADRSGSFSYWPQNPSDAELILDIAFSERNQKLQDKYPQNATIKDASHFRAAKTRYLDDIEKLLLSSGKKTAIISREDFSFFSAHKLQAMHTFFSRFSDDVTYCAFVRSPVAFMHSSFGQRLVSGASEFSLQWPQYRKRFRAADNVFGQENVKLRLYRGAHEGGPDIVDDFFDLVGLENPNLPKLRVNPTRSLEAVALMFLFRRSQANALTPWEPNQQLDRKLLHRLGKFGHQKLTFAKDLVYPILESHTEDIAWIEGRLGETVLDAPEDGERPIRSARDLIAVAEENSDAFQEFMFDNIRASKAKVQGRVVHNLFTMRNHAAPRSAFQKPSAVTFPRVGLMHIPKCGGTSMVAEISRHFDPARVYRGYDNPKFAGLDPERYDLLIGHVGFDLLRKQGCQVITMMRHPVARFLSHYYYWNQRGSDGNLTGADVDLASQLSLEEFVDQLENPILLHQFQNVTTWTFAHGIEPWRKKALTHLSDAEILQLAKDNLMSCAVVGRLENLSVFEAKCRGFLGKDVSLPTVNANPSRGSVDQIAPETIKKIEAYLNLDLKLYAWFSEMEDAAQEVTS